MMKTHIPIADDVLCGGSQNLVSMMSVDVCGRCLRKLARIFAMLSDEQLQALGLARDKDAPRPPPRKRPRIQHVVRDRETGELVPITSTFRERKK